jgi:PAS domain-containing protein
VKALNGEDAVHSSDNGEHDDRSRSDADERYHTLLNALDEGFCIIEVLFDANGKPYDYRFLETNQAFENQTGIKDAEGKSMREIAPSHEAHWFETYGQLRLYGAVAGSVRVRRAKSG